MHIHKMGKLLRGLSVTRLPQQTLCARGGICARGLSEHGGIHREPSTEAPLRRARKDCITPDRIQKKDDRLSKPVIR